MHDGKRGGGQGCEDSFLYGGKLLHIRSTHRPLTAYQNEFFRDNLQPMIIPALLAGGILKPIKQKIVQGATLLERGQKALDMLRKKEVSGERLVWRVSEA
jgi:hypothetical protein